MQQHNEQAYAKWDTEALVQCKNCQRTFLPDRLQIHLRSCKADRPLKARVGVEVENCLIKSNATRSKSPVKPANQRTAPTETQQLIKLQRAQYREARQIGQAQGASSQFSTLDDMHPEHFCAEAYQDSDTDQLPRSGSDYEER